MRRFDGHGSSSYRPTNPEAARQMNSAMEQMLAERQRQDAGLFKTEELGTVTVATGATVATVAVATKLEDKPLIKLYKQASDKPIDTTECYSLSS
jgi:hypothetical protein